MEKLTRFDDKCVIVKIPIGILTRKSPYEATRRCWRASLSRARMADYVLGTVNGKVICVYQDKTLLGILIEPPKRLLHFS